MKEFAVRQIETGFYAAPIRIADSFRTRFRGLMFRKKLQPKEGLLLKNCPAIHCCFMRFPIDVVYLDGAMTVVGLETVSPWHFGRRFQGVRHTLELSEGSCDRLKPGMRLEIKECEI